MITTKEETVKPAKGVPIMLEITEEDRQQADHYCQKDGCLIHTALSRMGYSGHFIYCDGAMLQDESTYTSNEICAQDLYYDRNADKKPYYGKEVVGKQIILYPSE